MEDLVEAGFTTCKIGFYEHISKKLNWYGEHKQCEEELKSKDFFSSNKNTRLFLKPSAKNVDGMEFYIKNYEDPFKYAKNSLFHSNIWLLMNKNSKLFMQFRSIITRLFEAGLVIRDELNVSVLDGSRKKGGYELSIYTRKKDQVILTWNYLYAGFYVWMGAVLISCFVFISELLYSHLKKKINSKCHNFFAIIASMDFD